ncbi:MAG TPA: triose-phosphate isomerase [Solirubrobacteraceae bacterium]
MRPFIAANWKMHKTQAEARAFVDALADPPGAVDVALCVPFTALAATVEAAQGRRLAVYAQNMHEAEQGAFTGEVSAAMLVDLGVDGVVLGHSERRQLFGETDRALAHKIPAALAAGLAPILCVGETEGERERGDMERKLRQQIQDDLREVEVERLAEITIAYEPIWAIGTGEVATPEQAQEAIGFVRALVAGRSKQAAEAVRILYGGSVNAGNAAELLALPDVDGALVGGASLEPDAFAAIVGAAR